MGTADDVAATAASYANGINDNVLKVNGQNLGAIDAAGSKLERLGQVVEAINAKTADTGVTAFLSSENGNHTVELRAAKEIKLEGFTEATTMLKDADTAAFDTATEYKALADDVGIHDISVKTQAEAWDALKKIDKSIDQVNSARGDLGALQTRFEKSIENIDIMNENISAARGRIVDADFAAETANLSRSQILQQAGTAMVAQANQLPQNVLSLLR